MKKVFNGPRTLDSEPISPLPTSCEPLAARTRSAPCHIGNQATIIPTMDRADKTPPIIETIPTSLSHPLISFVVFIKSCSITLSISIFPPFCHSNPFFTISQGFFFFPEIHHKVTKDTKKNNIFVITSPLYNKTQRGQR